MMNNSYFQTARATLPLFFTLGIIVSASHGSTMSPSGFEADFTLSFSSKEAVLANPDDPFVKEAAAWDHPYQRIFDRNMPWVQLVNEGDSMGEMIEFTLDIGDMDFHFSDEYFGSAIMVSDDNPVDIGVSSSLSNNGDSLHVSFTGFDPGEFVRFRIDIDPDDPDGFPHPDYRRVLFDLNGNDASDNAAYELRFASTDLGTEGVVEGVLPDFQFFGPSFSENGIRPYSVMEPVGVFEVGGSATIPEPSSWALAALGLLGLVSMRRHLRRNG